VILGTDTIQGNEPAWGLFELNYQSPRSKGFHRYQIIQIVRDGRIWEWRKDMGKAKRFKGINQLRIPSFTEHTVDELMAIANAIRGTSDIDVKGFLELNKYNPA